MGRRNRKRSKSEVTVHSEYTYDELRPLLVSDGLVFERGNERIKKQLKSARYKCFKRSNVCADCGRVGETFLSGDVQNPTANLYAADGVEMLQYLIVPRRLGGTADLSNTMTLCVPCQGVRNTEASMPEEKKESRRRKYRCKLNSVYMDIPYGSIRVLFGTLEKTLVDGWTVGMNSNRLRCLARSPVCTGCGKEGAFWRLEVPADSQAHTKGKPHWNLYCDDGSKMTQDHILPRSLGGSDGLHNLQTMCSSCNGKKGNDLAGDTFLDEDGNLLPMKTIRAMYSSTGRQGYRRGKKNEVKREV